MMMPAFDLTLAILALLLTPGPTKSLMLLAGAGVASGWTLAAKKGTDGRDGVRGDKGDRGAEGRAGRDLTQMGHDGSKW